MSELCKKMIGFFYEVAGKVNNPDSDAEMGFDTTRLA